MKALPLERVSKIEKLYPIQSAVLGSCIVPDYESGCSAPGFKSDMTYVQHLRRDVGAMAKGSWRHFFLSGGQHRHTHCRARLCQFRGKLTVFGGLIKGLLCRKSEIHPPRLRSCIVYQERGSNASIWGNICLEKGPNSDLNLGCRLSEIRAS